MKNDIEEIDTLEDIEKTMVFDISDEQKSNEKNVIKEKNEVVDFTEPIDVIKNDKIKKSKKKKSKKDNIFKKIGSWWSNLSKKAKIIIISISAAVIIGVIVAFVFILKKDNNEPKKEEDVIFEQDNYRYENGNLILQSTDKKDLGKYKCENKDEKKCYVAYLSNEDDFTQDLYLDQNGEKLVLRSNIYGENYVFIVDNKKGSNDDLLLYSIKSKSIVDKYTLVKSSLVNRSYIVLKNSEGKYGILDLAEDTPKTVVNFVYDYIGMISNESSTKYFVAKKNNKYYVLDYEEKVLSTGFNDYIVEYNDNFIVTKDSENKYEIYDYEGNKLVLDKSLFIKINGNYYASLMDNGLTVFDKSQTKYNAVPIGLSTTTYVRTKVYDANKQLISDDVAFELLVNEDNVTVSRGKVNDILSISEAEANKSHTFTSYFNGVLYVYQDEAKTTLLGKYECKNKNTSGQFDHCSLATSTQLSKNDTSSNSATGFINILNNRYVFIKDSMSGGNIYLYDLSSNKKMGPYSEVDVDNLFSETEAKSDINGAYIIAKNSKNLYGVIRVNATSADIALKFEYKEIERENENFLVKKSSDTYQILRTDGSQITSEFGNKIMNYNNDHVITKSNNKYKIYKKTGEQIDKNEYSYIKMENNYYVGIKDGNLGIYKYDNPSNNILKVNVAILDQDASKLNTTFTVTSNQSGYIVKINDGKNNKEYMFNNDGLDVNNIKVEETIAPEGEE